MAAVDPTQLLSRRKPLFIYATGTAYALDLFGQGVKPSGSGKLVSVTGLDGQVFTGPSYVKDDPFWRMVDPDLWRAVNVKFPDAIFPFKNSVDTGVKETIKLINANPGPFALGGYSQGAMVMSFVYNEIRYGSLQHRRKDLVAAVMFGNPVRATNALWPGGTWSGAWDVPGSTTGGHGCFPSEFRLSDVEPLWWEFVNEDDPITATGDSTGGTGGQAMQAAAEILTLYADLSDVEALLTGHTQINPKGLLTRLGGLLAGHMLYPVAPPPGDPQNGMTSFQIALQYLRSVGQKLKGNNRYLADQLITRTISDADAIDAGTLVARQKAAAPTEILMTVYDKFWRPIGECHDYIELSTSHPRNNVPTLMMTLKGTDPLVPVMRNCRNEVVGITVEIGSLRWAYTVDAASLKLQDGQRTCQVKALGIWDYLSYLLVWPNFALPIQTQVPSRAVFICPIVTVIEVMIAEQAFRLQTGMWEIVNNAGSLNPDWRAWFGTLLEAGGDGLYAISHTPIYVVHTNPLLDASPLVSVTVRMETCASVIEKLVKSYGVTVDMELWMPGDPQPDAWARLSVPTYVVRVSDRSGVTGPTGTILDSVVKQVVTLEESVLGGVLKPFLNPKGEYTPIGVYIAPTIGVHYVKPWTLLIDHPRGPLENFEIVDHHPQGWQIVIGGKSPKWFNDLINSTLAWVLDAITMAIGITGISGSMLDGFFNDILLAFQLIENFDRRTNMGPYGRPEKFVSTGAAPYNIDALFSFISAMWDSRGYRSAIAMYRNGFPYSVGRDVFPGSMMSIAENGQLFTDYVENIILTDNRNERCKVIVQIGDGKAEEAPIARFQRLITGLMESFNVLTLAPGT